MLKRERIVLRLLSKTAKPLTKTVFVKLVFLLRHETSLKKVPSFYDFVPYRFGPFSFTLYWELERLRRYGLVAVENEHVELHKANLARAYEEAKGMAAPANSAVTNIVSRYGQLSQRDLVSSVYCRYPWFALNSRLPERSLASIPCPANAPNAAYTVGYQGKSVDAFLNRLLKLGIRVLIDVRANPVSRKYGFSGTRLGQLSKRLGLEYCHVPSLGIPSNLRANLKGIASYQHLLDKYERSTLSLRSEEVRQVGQMMNQRASVLVCFEKDIHCCHRKRLATAVANETGLEVVHL